MKRCVSGAVLPLVALSLVPRPVWVKLYSRRRSDDAVIVAVVVLIRGGVAATTSFYCRSLALLPHVVWRNPGAPRESACTAAKAVSNV